MKVVDAKWELRNLGVTTQEIEIEDEDTLEEIEHELRILDASYQVAKISSMRIDAYALLSRYDFFLAEASIRVSHGLRDIICPSLVKRMSDILSFEEMDDNEIGIMNDQIERGMFQTDRVVLDPYFTQAQASNRYILWMKDELGKGSKLFSYKYKGGSVGFSCLKETKPNVFYPVLGGIYILDKALPIGSAIIHKQLEIARSLGGKELYTFISSNNPTVVKVYSQLGYIFEDIKYVFIKHR